MAMSTIKFQTPFTLCSSPHRFRLLSTASSSSSIRIADQNPNPKFPSAPGPHHRDPPPSKEAHLGQIVHRLRNLGLGLTDEDDDGLLDRPRPGPAQTPLPWERGRDEISEEKVERRRREKARARAEMVIEEAELRRLRGLGMKMERISVAKAGATREVVERIHDAWRRSEVVRVKFHESLAHDMKMAHELVEVKTVIFDEYSNLENMTVRQVTYFGVS